MINVEQQFDELTKKVWTFYVMVNYNEGVVLRLNHYAEQHRETKRHKFKSVVHWSTHDERSSTIKRAAVPLPDWVKEEAVKKLGVTVTI